MATDAGMKRPYVAAIGLFLLIPVVFVAAGALFSAIDPEAAAGHADYARNYRLLELARRLILGAGFLVNVALWFLACFLLLKSKKQSPVWIVLALFGPLGLIVITLLSDRAPAAHDLYRRFLSRLNLFVRIAYEGLVFVALWALAYQAMVLKRDLVIRYQSATTGVPVQQIVDVQNASSGMWAFSEGLEVMYLVVLFYLLWPVCFNAAGAAIRALASSRKA